MRINRFRSNNIYIYIYHEDMSIIQVQTNDIYTIVQYNRDEDNESVEDVYRTIKC